MDLESKTRRAFIGFGLAMTASAALPDVISAQSKPKRAASLDELPVLKTRRITWDKIKEVYDQYQGLNDRQMAANARGYHKLISKYLDQVFVDEFQIVYDKRRNPYGFIGDWYLLDDPKKRKQVEDRMKKEWTVGPADAEKRIELFDATNLYWISPKMRGYEVESGKRRGFIVVNDTIFKLKNEAELFSTVDHMRANAMSHEFKPRIGKKKWDEQDTGSKVYRSQIACLQGSITQVDNIISGKHKVSPGFSSRVINGYSFLYSNAQRFASDIERTANRTGLESKKNNADLIKMILADAESRFSKRGYEHRKVGSKYSLVKK